MKTKKNGPGRPKKAKIELKKAFPLRLNQPLIARIINRAKAEKKYKGTIAEEILEKNI